MRGTHPGAGSDGDLIRRCRQGNVGAWRELLDAYERLVYSIPLKHGLSRDDAADVAQFTFTFLVQSLDALPDDGRLGAWLAAVARRHTRRLLERDRRQEILSESLDRMGLTESAALLLGGHDADVAEHWELSEWLDRGLSKAGQRCRDILLALYFQPGRPSYAEVGEKVGVAPESVGPARARCLRRLKQVLGES